MLRGGVLKGVVGLVTAVVLVLSACSDIPLAIVNGGSKGSGMSTGTITNFGSVYVNGIKFDTSNASITVNGEEVSEDELHVGMISTIDGTIVQKIAQVMHLVLISHSM